MSPMSDSDLALESCSRILQQSYNGLPSAGRASRFEKDSQDSRLKRYFKEKHESGVTAVFRTDSGAKLAVKSAISSFPDSRNRSRSYILVFGWENRNVPQFRANVLSELNSVTEGVYIYCRKPRITQFVAGMENREMLERYVDNR